MVATGLQAERSLPIAAFDPALKNIRD